MRYIVIAGLAAIAIFGVLGVRRVRADNVSPTTQPGGDPTTQPSAANVLDFRMKTLNGKEVDLSSYRGKVILIVNTASKCGYTPQYAGLEKIYEKYADKGFVILGFPSNDFGHQEPGTDQEIGEFCLKNYGVKFDMFSKVDVKGSNKCPLYHYLTDVGTDPKFAGEVKWNFEKFLINRDGVIVNRFRSKVTPESDVVVGAIEAEIAKTQATN
jgi:glutathione peroxidase